MSTHLQSHRLAGEHGYKDMYTFSVTPALSSLPFPRSELLGEVLALIPVCSSLSEVVSMKFNYTLDAPSPLLHYLGAWSPVANASDTDVSLYRNGTAVKTYTTGDSAQFSFNGTGVWVYGSKRWNHGDYDVDLDGASTSGSGQPDGGQDAFQQLLFGSGDLASGPHQLAITNKGFSNSTSGYFDIDYILWEGSLPDGSSVKRFTTDNPAFEYLPSFSSWAWAPDKNGYSSSQYYTQSLNGEFKFRFTGASVSLAGFLESNHGNFSCAVDNVSYGVASGYYSHMVYQQTLCFVDGLANGEHTLTVKNIPISSYEPWLAIDFVEVGGIRVASILNGSSGLKTSTKIGLAVGGVIGGFFIICLLVFAYMRWKKEERHERHTVRHRDVDIEPASPIDLLTGRVTPYPEAMSSFPGEETGYAATMQRMAYHRRGDSDDMSTVTPSESASQAGRSPPAIQSYYSSSASSYLLPKDWKRPLSDATSSSLANRYRAPIPEEDAGPILRASNPEDHSEDDMEEAEARAVVRETLPPVYHSIVGSHTKHDGSQAGDPNGSI
ncbi:hypothetical protein DL93DRAFT_2166436 [Clavulina sp. PMI_390]|nr:hypothetical protein DL93DRAFT_2166436 [Clavulina sp. PMI_390]